MNLCNSFKIKRKSAIIEKITYFEGKCEIEEGKQTKYKKKSGRYFQKKHYLTNL
ncbi:hypothetical protein B598_0854 [Chlamydia psittaci GR9]|nr:hypothetical protein B598_0854 [Chlamydia psittaci GR9]AFS23462.1 hypothetical protein B601_0857 [Chlamydia psittaci WS/RT/E30]